MSCLRLLYSLCDFLTDNFSGSTCSLSKFRADKISFWLITLLVSHTCLSSARSTGNIFVLQLVLFSMPPGTALQEQEQSRSWESGGKEGHFMSRGTNAWYGTERKEAQAEEQVAPFSSKCL